MKERIVCFALGLSGEDMEKGRASFYGLNREIRLDVVAVTEDMLDAQVGKILDGVTAGFEPNNTGKQQSGATALPPDLNQYRVVMVNTMEREQVLQVMRSFKAVLRDPQELIFAVITDTARTWTFGDYIGHLGREHEHMKSRNPG
ncbi:MAG: hypothetical protein CVU71_16875 [Deltaproteobacteria bacterium HGW-Deltaproteobacteria-6]|jgi:DNA-binding Lrp family transcriptional regulator|nr:MAG: hypothetical protein CVU71_16875 [Deltaproteobacteria bacterium HGW-Deltaproteobacteria-6]